MLCFSQHRVALKCTKLMPCMCFSWYKARHGSLMVATASAGAAAVRKADPAHYPAAPHAYFRLGEHELTAPLLCAVCFEHVEPNNLFQVSNTCQTVLRELEAVTTVAHLLTLAACHAHNMKRSQSCLYVFMLMAPWNLLVTSCLLQRGSCCEVCGILAHEGCARQVPDDCRPIALPAEKVLHTWKAAGTLMIESQVLHSSTSHSVSAASKHATCIYAALHNSTHPV